MAVIKFKGKIKKIQDKEFIKIPELTRAHCDMQAFRIHKIYGWASNSELFLSVLKRIKKEVFGESRFLDINNLPENIKVIKGFLTTIIIDI